MAVALVAGTVAVAAAGKHHGPITLLAAARGVADDAGFIRKRMARVMPPDLRDRRELGAIQGWAKTIAASLTDGRAEAAGLQPRPRSGRVIRRSW